LYLLLFIKKDITKLLLDNGADPYIKEVMGGATPMSIAKVKNNPSAIKLLEEYL